MTEGPGSRQRSVLARQARSRRVSALLCLGLVVGLGVGLTQWTHGFEAWTFEARRQLQIQAGTLQAPAIAWRAHDGSPLRLWGEAGASPHAYLVDFIYTRCPGVCRALGSEYQRMQRTLANMEGDTLTGAKADAPAVSGVQLVSVSIDPVHDGAAQLARYSHEMQVAARFWTLAVPATADDAQRLLRSLGVVVVPDGMGGFVHNGDIHLLDAQGRLRGLFELGQWPQALEAAQRLATPPRGAAP